MAYEAEYYTPDGCVDLPYMLVYDAAALTDGNTYQSQLKQVGYDYDFVLRAILGAPSVLNSTTGGMRLYNYSGSRAFDDYITPMSQVFAVVPEKIYPKNTGVKFDLKNILRANTACPATATIYRSQLIFQGVQRYRPDVPGYSPGAPALPAIADPATYNLRPWTYTFSLNLSWFANVTATLPNVPRTFTIEVTDYDFELHTLYAANVTTGLSLTSTDLFQMRLYDATGKRPLSDVPVNWSCFPGTGITFPVPPLVYPVWTQIKFDIASLICNSDGSAPYTIQITFVGAQRIPIIKGGT